ncbi:MAG: hypothetical protein Q8P40_06700 [Nitrospirota bacterium]|nr:hypothetical protein [Nitrospirota bacterium]
MESIPVAMVEINAYHVRHHIDITCSTGNYYYIRRSGKYQRREGNANADVHIPGRTSEQHAQNKKQRNHKQYDLLHKVVPPFG